MRAFKTRAFTTLALSLAMAVAASGCAATSKLGIPKFALVSDPAIVVDGLRGVNEDQFIKEARLATPPGCAVETVHVLSESEATFTFTCFDGGATVTGL